MWITNRYCKCLGGFGFKILNPVTEIINHEPNIPLNYLVTQKITPSASLAVEHLSMYVQVISILWKKMDQILVFTQFRKTEK